MDSRFLFIARKELAIARRRLAWKVLYAFVFFLPSTSYFFCFFLIHLKKLNETLNTLEKGYRKKKLTSLPTSLIIDTTSHCQLKCKLCFRQHHSENLNNKPDISIYHLDKIITELFPTAKSINLTLIGEPLLSSHIERVIKSAKKYHVKIGLITNGMLLDKVAGIKDFIDVLGSVEISLDSLQQALLEELRENVNYPKLMRNIDLIKTIKVQSTDSFHLSFSVTILSCNIDELPDIINFASKNGADSVRCCLGVIYDREDAALSILNCIEKYNVIHDQCLELALEKGLYLSLPEKIANNHHSIFKGKEPCTYIYDMIRINNEGELTSCLHSDPPFQETISNTKIKKIWNCPEMQTLRETYDRDDANPVCKDCYIVSRQGHSREFHKKQLHYFNYSSAQDA